MLGLRGGFGTEALRSIVVTALTAEAKAGFLFTGVRGGVAGEDGVEGEFETI